MNFYFIVWFVFLITLYVVLKVEKKKTVKKEDEYIKKIVDLEDKVDALLKADKVINNCVLYGELPLVVKTDNNVFIDCCFENLGRKPDNGALSALLTDGSTDSVLGRRI